MLLQLSVRNFTLIQSLDFIPGKELSIITGETGAGKSILMGALGLILGDRASSELTAKNKKCVVEGKFSITGYSLKSFFKENDLDYEEETILRREIGADGKSRAFVNDSPVNLSVLKELGEKLIDIHSQHETLLLNQSAFQTNLLDLFSGNKKIKDHYTKVYSDWKSAHEDLKKREEQHLRNLQEQDYLRFQFSELEEAGLETIDQEKLEQELKLQENSSQIRKTLEETSLLFEQEQNGVLSSINKIKNNLSGIVRHNKELESLHNRIQSGLLELKDIAAETAQLSESIIDDPVKSEKIKTQLDKLFRLQQKHRVQNVVALLELKKQLEEKLGGIENNSEEIGKRRAESERLYTELQKLGAELRKSRKASIPKLQVEVNTILHSLAMPQTSFIVASNPLLEPEKNGMDEIKFLFSANRGTDPKEISKIASGGELSRLMLTLKSIVARLSNLPTIIFDEIDTGVSGAVAGKVALIMEQMGKKMQVITITHLPQVASKGQTHFKVFKENKGTGPVTGIQQLNKEDRIKEIAGMLSAGETGKSALSNAKELLGL